MRRFLGKSSPNFFGFVREAVGKLPLVKFEWLQVLSQIDLPARRLFRPSGRYGQELPSIYLIAQNLQKNGRVIPNFPGTKCSGRFTGDSLPTNDIPLYLLRGFRAKPQNKK